MPLEVGLPYRVREIIGRVIADRTVTAARGVDPTRLGVALTATMDRILRILVLAISAVTIASTTSGISEAIAGEGAGTSMMKVETSTGNVTTSTGIVTIVAAVGGIVVRRTTTPAATMTDRKAPEVVDGIARALVMEVETNGEAREYILMQIPVLHDRGVGTTLHMMGVPIVGVAIRGIIETMEHIKAIVEALSMMATAMTAERWGRLRLGKLAAVGVIVLGDEHRSYSMCI
jgi:hypothetical protein